MTAATLGLEKLAGRCPDGYDMATQHPRLCSCSAGQAGEWPTFVAILRKVQRADGTVHACDVRPLVRDVIEPRQISSCYRRARNEGLLVEAGTERSNDVAGKNAGRHEPFYELRSAA